MPGREWSQAEFPSPEIVRSRHVELILSLASDLCRKSCCPNTHIIRDVVCMLTTYMRGSVISLEMRLGILSIGTGHDLLRP